MPEFLLHDRNPTFVKIKNNVKFWLVEFHLTETQRDTFPLWEAAKLCDDEVLRLFSDPMPGDSITYRGYEWRVIRRLLPGCKRGEHAPNLAGRVITEMVRPELELGQYVI